VGRMAVRQAFILCPANFSMCVTVPLKSNRLCKLRRNRLKRQAIDETSFIIAAF